MNRLLRIVLESVMVLSLLPVSSLMSFAYANEQNYYEILSDYFNAYELCVNPNTNYQLVYNIYPNVNGEFILAVRGSESETKRPKYYLKDLDYDGVPELFIGVEESTYAVQSNQHLYGVYTYKNGQVISIFDGIGDRTKAYLLDDNSMWIEGSASWQSFYGGKNILSGEQCEVTEELVTYENDVWYYNGSLVSRAQADKILQQNRNRVIHVDWSDITPKVLTAGGGVKKLVLLQNSETNGTYFSDIYTYYENGDLRSSLAIWYYRPGGFIERGEGSIYEYDADGRLVLSNHIFTDKYGNVEEGYDADRAVYQYDSAGRWISYDDVYGDYVVKINLEYGGDGRIKKISRQAAGFNAEYSYRYDDQSNTAYVDWQQTTSDGSGDNYTSGSYSLIYDNTGSVLEITGDDARYALEYNIFGQEDNRPTDPLEMYKNELDNDIISYDSDGDPIRVKNKNSGVVWELTYNWIGVKEPDSPNTPETPDTPFQDVAANAWYYDAVAWAVENGITSGTGGGIFSPESNCTRAQIVTFLWRAAGSPAVTATNKFTDVEAGAYYADAVAWAVANDIAQGITATTFSPNKECTRAEAVTFLYRANNSPAVSGSNSFKDVASDSWYANAIQWAVNTGVTAGTSATTFSPDQTCARAQIVTFLYRDRAN